MVDGHHGSGGNGVDSPSSHDPGHPLHNHEGDDVRHDKHHNHYHNGAFDRSDPYTPAGSQNPEATGRWRQGPYEADDEDPEQQPLLTSRSRRVSPGPTVAIVGLIVIIAVMSIVIVTMKSNDGYTGSGGAFE